MPFLLPPDARERPQFGFQFNGFRMSNEGWKHVGDIESFFEIAGSHFELLQGCERTPPLI